MRYAEYKAIVELSNSVVEATEHIKEHPEMVGMLVDCGEAISAIKSNLEINGEEAIDEIKDFFNIIDVMADKIANNEDYASMLSKLCEISLKINNYCKKNIKYKFKIVFFAEIGSKWDAMDSVYRAYKAREDCEVLVVLAPVFRAIKLPNGEIKSDVIYTDYLTGMGIEHMPFQKYDIKKDLPDLVFTSQPYESVTTEQFWAENIAPYTRLVYLPYFTAGGAINDEEKFVQCQMPIHKLAWKVVCQSDKAKEVYSKYSPVGGKNLIACGLPKWDYVVNMNNREIEFPKEWEKLKGKKIILRNCHYNIRNPESFMKIVHEALDIFEGTDMGYLYRFHPLVETMFNVYYPDFKERWEALKSEIDNSKNVAIDRNVTYDAAFMFSDVLLTGYTSLVSQYLLTKKPVIMQHWGQYENAKKAEESKEVFVKMTELYPVDTLTEAYNLCEKIFFNDDFEYEKRMNFINETLPNSDGKIGERLSSQLINDMLLEDNML